MAISTNQYHHCQFLNKIGQTLLNKKRHVVKRLIFDSIHVFGTSNLLEVTMMIPVQTRHAIICPKYFYQNILMSTFVSK
jgi:hypothetical protein